VTESPPPLGPDDAALTFLRSNVVAQRPNQFAVGVAPLAEQVLAEFVAEDRATRRSALVASGAGLAIAAIP
jgi:hypothetical protein